MKAAIITVNTLGYQGQQQDEIGPCVQEVVKNAGIDVKVMRVLPNDAGILSEVMQRLADSNIVDVILTIGGTGFFATDVTPEATKKVLECELPGVAEAIRVYNLQLGECAMFSRGVAGIRKKTMIVNLPDTVATVERAAEYILPYLISGVNALQQL